MDEADPAAAVRMLHLRQQLLKLQKTDKAKEKGTFAFAMRVPSRHSAWNVCFSLAEQISCHIGFMLYHAITPYEPYEWVDQVASSPSFYRIEKMVNVGCWGVVCSQKVREILCSTLCPHTCVLH